MQIDPEGVWSDIVAIRQCSPLIHNITNYVVMEQSANALLALGASPVMAHALEEVEEWATRASSLVLNIGTLSAAWIQAMLRALQAANFKGLPVVFDPVGVGATQYRSQEAHHILSHGHIATIRGNASEITYLNSHRGETKGVDSLLRSYDCIVEAQSLAMRCNSIVWMSGQMDVVTDGQTAVLIHNGDLLMSKVVGMGCTATAITAAFLVVNSNKLQATAHAALLIGIAGQIAASEVSGPGSFKTQFLDVLHNLSLAQIQECACVEIV